MDVTVVHKGESPTWANHIQKSNHIFYNDCQNCTIVPTTTFFVRTSVYPFKGTKDLGLC